MFQAQSYRHFISAWDSVPFGEKNLASLTGRMLKEEKLTKMYDQATATSTPDSAFLARRSLTYQQFTPAENSPKPYFNRVSRGSQSGFRGGYRGGRSQRGGGSSWRVCHYCKFPGHVAVTAGSSKETSVVNMESVNATIRILATRQSISRIDGISNKFYRHCASTTPS